MGVGGVVFFFCYGTNLGRLFRNISSFKNVRVTFFSFSFTPKQISLLKLDMQVLDFSAVINVTFRKEMKHLNKQWYWIVLLIFL